MIARDPRQADAWLNLGGAVEELDGAGAALALYEAALGHLPDETRLLYNAAELHQRRGETTAALALYGRILGIDPDFAAAWLNAGMALKREGRLDLAEDFYRRAIALGDPAGLAKAWFNLAHLLLAQERWAEGWAAYEWRLALPSAPRPDFGIPRWTGGEGPGTLVLLWSDQGFGDTIQFLRYAPVLAGKGHRVRLYTSDLLVPLLAGAAGIESVHGLSGPPPEADCDLPVGSLPLVAGAGAPTWPGPYLAAPEPMALAGERRVGLVWAGNPAHVNDAHRSRRLEDLAPLLAVPGIAWFSLQTGAAGAALAGSPWADRIVDLAPRLADFAATAAAMAALDLVITVDTASVHLAGALGRPAWLLLPAVEPDWRWGLEGERSAWYPSLRLFRTGIEDMAAALAAREW